MLLAPGPTEKLNTSTVLVALYFTQTAAGAKDLEITGDITVNGQSMSRSFFLENAAYVPQEDRLWSALTGEHPESIAGLLQCCTFAPGALAENTYRSGW